jgi:hypothetical protein
MSYNKDLKIIPLTENQKKGFADYLKDVWYNIDNPTKEQFDGFWWLEPKTGEVTKSATSGESVTITLTKDNFFNA